MTSNYPPGAEEDDRAPYNEIEPIFVPCEFCEGIGVLIDDNGKKIQCEDCVGTGETIANYDEIRELFESKKEDKLDL